MLVVTVIGGPGEQPFSVALDRRDARELALAIVRRRDVLARDGIERPALLDLQRVL
jgi:hypothetical protein